MFKKIMIGTLVGTVSSLSLGALYLKVNAQQYKPDPHAARTVNQLRKELPPLNLNQPYHSQSFQEYLNFYALEHENTAHFAGYLNYTSKTLKERIFVHIFKPEQPKGTVVLLHGYFVHSAIQRHIIHDLLRQNYAIYALDLPGHGLSSGPRAAIDDFSHYAGVIQTVTDTLETHLPKPWHIMAHSTGGAGVIEYILTQPKHPYQKVVLAAPLIRSYLWDLSKFGFNLGSGFLPEVPRVIRATTSDPSFLEFVNSDPLQYMATPTRWVAALFRWHENQVPYWPPSQQEVLVLQGTEDTVLEWQYNLNFLRRKFPRARMVELQGARHDLFWESPQIRKVMFQHIEDFLNAP